MQFLRNLLDKAEKPFHKGGKLEKLYPLYEATDAFLYLSLIHISEPTRPY